MSDRISSRLKNSWNAFFSGDSQREEMNNPYVGMGSGGGIRVSRAAGYSTNKNSIIDPIYNRIGIDVASVNIRHTRVDSNNRYISEMDSYLTQCLMFEPNIDQSPAAFFRDAVMTLCEVGAIAIVPVESVGNPFTSTSFDPISLRVGYITQFYAQHVRVRLYNDQTALYEEKLLPKRMCAIVENPLYTVMNEPNSILQRLLNKLRVLDTLDENSMAGKLDMVIQLPFPLKTEAKKAEAEKRRQEIESQLENGKLGVAYIDGTERITQLNRPVGNNVLAEVEWLTGMLYSQLGLTQEVVAGTADESAMINYHNRTIEPFLTAIVEAMTRSFISRTGRAQGQRIAFHRDPFKHVPASQFAEIADKFTRNEIATANDVRSTIGWVPSKDEKADELRNSNLSKPKDNPEREKLELEMMQIENDRARKELEMMDAPAPAPSAPELDDPNIEDAEVVEDGDSDPELEAALAELEDLVESILAGEEDDE